MYLVIIYQQFLLKYLSIKSMYIMAVHYHIVHCLMEEKLFVVKIFRVGI